MRPTILLFPVLAAAMLASACNAGGRQAAAPSTAEPEPPPEREPVVRQITTLEGDEDDYFDAVRPEVLILQEFTDAYALEWELWGPDIAVADGKVSGMWCIPDCTSEGYDATIVLCDVEDGYFTRFGVFGDFPGYDPENTTFGSPLYFTDRPFHEANWYGCDEPDLDLYS